MRSIERDLGAHAEGDLGGVGADDAAADDADVAGGDAGDSAEQDAAAAVLFFEVGCADLDGHAAGDFAHRGEQRQRAGAVADRLVGDAGDLLFEQRVGELGKRREVEVGEEDEAFAEVAVLLLDGLLDLDDHVGEAPDVVGGADDLGAVGLVLVVGHGGESAGVVLDEDLVAGLDQGLDAGGSDADAALVIFYFFGNANNHFRSPLVTALIVSIPSVRVRSQVAYTVLASTHRPRRMAEHPEIWNQRYATRFPIDFKTALPGAGWRTRAGGDDGVCVSLRRRRAGWALDGGGERCSAARAGREWTCSSCCRDF